MGGAVALLYAGTTKTIPAQVKGVISDCSYACYKKVVFRILTISCKSKVLSWSLLVSASFACFINTGIFYSKMSPEKCIRNIELPVLLFHGEKDAVVPLSLVQQMLDTARNLGFLVAVIPDAPHIGSYFYAQNEYMEKIVTFSK